MLLVMLVMRRILVKHAVNNEIATAYRHGVLCLFPLNVHIQRWVDLVFYTIQFSLFKWSLYSFDNNLYSYTVTRQLGS